MRKQLFTLLMCGIFVVMGSLYPLMVNAKEPETRNGVPQEEWKWTYEYTGTEQVFRAPYSGIYQFEIYGAQGGAAGLNEGGKGGKVTAAVALSKNEEILIYVGGMNGYHGGGIGNRSSGGGATDVRKGGNGLSDRILVAGGGGGANQIYAGEDGGIDLSVAVINSGEGESTSEGAGGGAGYQGGSAGIEHIVSHTHQGDASYGGNCYSPDYHSHIGNESVYGGCYVIETQKPIHVEHNWYVTGRGETINWSGEVVEGEGETQYISTTYPVRDEHGHIGEITWCSHAWGVRENMKGGWSFIHGDEYGYAGGQLADEPVNFTFTTSKETPVIYYELGCGQTTETITGYHLNCSKVYDEYEVRQAAGGTNYYKEDVCHNAVSEAGIQTGDGLCSIRLLALYNLYYGGSESFHVYYDEIKVKRVYYKGHLIYRE